MQQMRPLSAILAATALGLLAAAGPARAETLYECSGIGADEREAAEGIPHTVRLVFAQPDGHYLGGVETRLKDATGAEILAVTCPGPWVLLKLPDGRYEVTVSLHGVTQSRAIAVSGGQLQKQVFWF
jgi:hypothetical protein